MQNEEIEKLRSSVVSLGVRVVELEKSLSIEQGKYDDLFSEHTLCKQQLDALQENYENLCEENLILRRELEKERAKPFWERCFRK